MIRSIYLHPKDSSGVSPVSLIASYKSVSILNKLYGNDTLSALNLEKVSKPPILSKPNDNKIEEDVISAHEKLQTRRKLALILNSNGLRQILVNIGDLLEILSRKQHEKSGSWYALKQILSFFHPARPITIPGKYRNVLTIPI